MTLAERFKNLFKVRTKTVPYSASQTSHVQPTVIRKARPSTAKITRSKYAGYRVVNNVWYDNSDDVINDSYLIWNLVWLLSDSNNYTDDFSYDSYDYSYDPQFPAYDSNSVYVGDTNTDNTFVPTDLPTPDYSDNNVAPDVSNNSDNYTPSSDTPSYSDTYTPSSDSYTSSSDNYSSSNDSYSSSSDSYSSSNDSSSYDSSSDSGGW